MNELQKRMFHAPSIITPECPFCGRPSTNRHHIIPRSQGGHDGPTIDVCGMGNASGCHGRLHDHTLHLRYEGDWQYLRTDQPTKYQDALAMDGWRSIDAPFSERMREEAESIRKRSETRQQILDRGIDQDG